MRRFLIGLVVQTTLLTSLVMGPFWALTGSLAWPRGWLAVGLLFTASAGGGLWVLRTNPGLVHERATLQPARSRADGLATALIALAVAIWFVGAAWDAGRLRLITLPDAVSLSAGAAPSPWD